MDTSEFGGDRAHKERIVELSVGLFRALGAFPKPIVAAINGPAVAGGFALALLCDIRLASTDARMGFLENQAGIPPSYAAARAALPAALAAELCLTGRLLDADEARGLGVVSDVHAPDEPHAARARRSRRRSPPRRRARRSRPSAGSSSSARRAGARSSRPRSRRS